MVIDYLIWLVIVPIFLAEVAYIARAIIRLACANGNADFPTEPDLETELHPFEPSRLHHAKSDATGGNSHQRRIARRSLFRAAKLRNA